jgi:hypothetical protein
MDKRQTTGFLVLMKIATKKNFGKKVRDIILERPGEKIYLILNKLLKH